MGVKAGDEVEVWPALQVGVPIIRISVASSDAAAVGHLWVGPTLL